MFPPHRNSNSSHRHTIGVIHAPIGVPYSHADYYSYSSLSGAQQISQPQQSAYVVDTSATAFSFPQLLTPSARTSSNLSIYPPSHTQSRASLAPAHAHEYGGSSSRLQGYREAFMPPSYQYENINNSAPQGAPMFCRRAGKLVPAFVLESRRDPNFLLLSSAPPVVEPTIMIRSPVKPKQGKPSPRPSRGVTLTALDPPSPDSVVSWVKSAVPNQPYRPYHRKPMPHVPALDFAHQPEPEPHEVEEPDENVMYTIPAAAEPRLEPESEPVAEEAEPEMEPDPQPEAEPESEPEEQQQPEPEVEPEPEPEPAINQQQLQEAEEERRRVEEEEKPQQEQARVEAQARAQAEAVAAAEAEAARVAAEQEAIRVAEAEKVAAIERERVEAEQARVVRAEQQKALEAQLLIKEQQRQEELKAVQAERERTAEIARVAAAEESARVEQENAARLERFKAKEAKLEAEREAQRVAEAAAEAKRQEEQAKQEEQRRVEAAKQEEQRRVEAAKQAEIDRVAAIEAARVKAERDAIEAAENAKREAVEAEQRRIQAILKAEEDKVFESNVAQDKEWLEGQVATVGVAEKQSFEAREKELQLSVDTCEQEVLQIKDEQAAAAAKVKKDAVDEIEAAARYDFRSDAPSDATLFSHINVRLDYDAMQQYWQSHPTATDQQGSAASKQQMTRTHRLALEKAKSVTIGAKAGLDGIAKDDGLDFLNTFEPYLEILALRTTKSQVSKPIWEQMLQKNEGENVVRIGESIFIVAARVEADSMDSLPLPPSETSPSIGNRCVSIRFRNVLVRIARMAMSQYLRPIRFRLWTRRRGLVPALCGEFTTTIRSLCCSAKGGVFMDDPNAPPRAADFHYTLVLGPTEHINQQALTQGPEQIRSLIQSSPDWGVLGECRFERACEYRWKNYDQFSDYLKQSAKDAKKSSNKIKTDAEATPTSDDTTLFQSNSVFKQEFRWQLQVTLRISHVTNPFRPLAPFIAVYREVVDPSEATQLLQGDSALSSISSSNFNRRTSLTSSMRSSTSSLPNSTPRPSVLLHAQTMYCEVYRTELKFRDEHPAYDRLTLDTQQLMNEKSQMNTKCLFVLWNAGYVIEDSLEGALRDHPERCDVKKCRLLGFTATNLKSLAKASNPSKSSSSSKSNSKSSGAPNADDDELTRALRTTQLQLQLNSDREPLQFVTAAAATKKLASPFELTTVPQEPVLTTALEEVAAGIKLRVEAESDESNSATPAAAVNANGQPVKLASTVVNLLMSGITLLAPSSFLVDIAADAEKRAKKLQKAEKKRLKYENELVELRKAYATEVTDQVSQARAKKREELNTSMVAAHGQGRFIRPVNLIQLAPTMQQIMEAQQQQQQLS